MDGVRRRLRRKAGTVEACTFQCERGLPWGTASRTDLEAFHAAKTATLTGGYDPREVFR